MTVKIPLLEFSCNKGVFLLLLVFFPLDEEIMAKLKSVQLSVQDSQTVFHHDGEHLT